MAIIEFLFFVPLMAFLVIVAPIWIVAHYLTRWRTANSLSSEDERLLAEIWENLDKMENRIHSLERILDAEASDWRTQR